LLPLKEMMMGREWPLLMPPLMVMKTF